MANGVLQYSVFIVTEWVHKTVSKGVERHIMKHLFLFMLFLIHLCIITESCLEKKKKIKSQNLLRTYDGAFYAQNLSRV